jgi:magnesium-transporting ATPase (P-type)
MLFALFDQEYLKDELMAKPKLYKIGLKNQCFSTKIFWQWILYGFAMSSIVFYVSFVTFNESPSEQGQLGDMWLEGTFAYGAIVIVANMTILYGSYSHSIISFFMIVLSVSAYFGIFWLFSFLKISTLAD